MSSARTPDQPFDLLQIFGRHRAKMFVTFALVFAATICYAVFTKRLYVSEAKLFIRLGRETIGLDPSATTSEIVSVQDSRENEVNSIEQLLKSRSIAEEVVDSIGPKLVLEVKEKPGLLAPLQKLNPFYVDSPRDAAISKLQKRLRVLPTEHSSVITLSYKADSVDLSQQVLAAVLASARQTHIRINRIDGSDAFFAEQAKEWKAKVDHLEAQMGEFKNLSGVSSFDQQREIQLNRIATIKTQLLDTESQFAATTAQLALQEEQVKAEPAEIQLVHVSGMPNSSAQEMRKQLYSVQLKQDELLGKFQPEHADVLQIRDQIEAANRTLKDESQLTQVTQGLNTVRQELRVSMLNQKASVASLDARTRALHEKLAAAENEMKLLNEQEPKFRALTRELEQARSSYLTYSQKHEQARIDRALSTDSISNINILQPPSRCEIPAWPQPLLSVALGLALGLIMSMLVAIVAEYRGPSLPQASPAPAPKAQSSRVARSRNATA